ncbi:ATP-binding cassette domain-containing protein [Niallia sp. XMNu-256]|uniref:ABC transporter ATP-binding protein n=1 Tax=Niallia sp. XMNu-256 TaxID=3082444 RepID=UPI0030D22A26
MHIEANAIGFRYEKGPWLFRDVNLTFRSGEIIGITGQSGYGKTTFCRILAGFEKPVEGTVTFDGKPYSNKSYHPVQLVFQHPEKAVNPRWKMKKVLNEGWQPDGEILDLLGIQQEWLERWPNELSGGELQRFCVARALGPHTRFLIADEMTTMLDAITQAQIWHAVLEIAQQRNMGIIIVSHEAKLLERLCHRIIQFDQLK